jgi:colanic acid biosynthesis protein WcaH
MLSKKDFIDIVRNTPLVAIDLIIENKEGEILLGWRNNFPAKGFWFVPGGRIRKDEHFEDAFNRIVKTEIGIEYALGDTTFLGVFEHIYPNENFAAEPGFGTHYIVIAYRIKIDKKIEELPLDQHQDYWWATLDEILEDGNVHENTRNYFNGHPGFAE